MNFKKAGLPDLRELREIGIETYLPHYSHLWKPGGVEWYLNRCFGEDYLKRELANDNVEYYIVENQSEKIGMMKIVLQKRLPDSNVENALYLEKIYFVREWTGKGVGRKSIEFALRRAAQLNRHCVWLEAMDTAAKPIEAYEKAGFLRHSKFRLGADFNLMKEKYRGMIVMVNHTVNNEN